MHGAVFLAIGSAKICEEGIEGICSFTISYYPEVCIRTNTFKAVDRKLYQCSSTSQNINKLFRIFRCREWPKARAYATGHNYYVIHNNDLILFYTNIPKTYLHKKSSIRGKQYRGDDVSVSYLKRLTFSFQAGKGAFSLIS